MSTDNEAYEFIEDGAPLEEKASACIATILHQDPTIADLGKCFGPYSTDKVTLPRFFIKSTRGSESISNSIIYTVDTEIAFRYVVGKKNPTPEEAKLIWAKADQALAQCPADTLADALSNIRADFLCHSVEATGSEISSSSGEKTNTISLTLICATI